jgi:hypothetical protein
MYQMGGGGGYSVGVLKSTANYTACVSYDSEATPTITDRQ